MVCMVGVHRDGAAVTAPLLLKPQPRHDAATLHLRRVAEFTEEEEEERAKEEEKEEEKKEEQEKEEE